MLHVHTKMCRFWSLKIPWWLNFTYEPWTIISALTYRNVILLCYHKRHSMTKVIILFFCFKMLCLSVFNNLPKYFHCHIIYNTHQKFLDTCNYINFMHIYLILSHILDVNDINCWDIHVGYGYIKLGKLMWCYLSAK